MIVSYAAYVPYTYVPTQKKVGSYATYVLANIHIYVGYWFYCLSQWYGIIMGTYTCIRHYLLK